MALIDVSDILLDPDFTNEVTLIRRASSLNSYGEHALVETATTKTAVVQGLQTEDIVKLPEGARLQDSITVYYKGELNAQSLGGYSDIILWRGKRYQVVTIDENYMNYGVGFTRAICVMEAVSA